jgi:hypothetical protein
MVVAANRNHTAAFGSSGCLVQHGSGTVHLRALLNKTGREDVGRTRRSGEKTSQAGGIGIADVIAVFRPSDRKNAKERLRTRGPDSDRLSARSVRESSSAWILAKPVPKPQKGRKTRR